MCVRCYTVLCALVWDVNAGMIMPATEGCVQCVRLLRRTAAQHYYGSVIAERQ